MSSATGMFFFSDEYSTYLHKFYIVDLYYGKIDNPVPKYI